MSNRGQAIPCVRIMEVPSWHMIQGLEGRKRAVTPQCICLEVWQVTFAHISLAKTGHVVLLTTSPGWKGKLLFVLRRPEICVISPNVYYRLATCRLAQIPRIEKQSSHNGWLLYARHHCFGIHDFGSGVGGHLSKQHIDLMKMWKFRVVLPELCSIRMEQSEIYFL